VRSQFLQNKPAGQIHRKDMKTSIKIDGAIMEAKRDERFVDLLNRIGNKIPQACYHPQMGPIQTCDTCMVEIGGKFVRAWTSTDSTNGLVPKSLIERMAFTICAACHPFGIARAWCTPHSGEFPFAQG